MINGFLNDNIKVHVELKFAQMEHHDVDAHVHFNSLISLLTLICINLNLKFSFLTYDHCMFRF